MFNLMLRSASQPLCNAIFEVSTMFIHKFKDYIIPNVLNPIYSAALRKVSSLKSALDFVHIISYVDPSIANATQSIESENSKTLEQVISKIESMNTINSDPIPITNCKNISQLHGIIDQLNPPKITPFSTEHEMFVGLQKAEDNKGKHKLAIKRMSSVFSMSKVLNLNIKSNVMVMLSKEDQDKETPKLPTPKLLGSLNIEQKEPQRTFLFTLDEFVGLKFSKM